MARSTELCAEASSLLVVAIVVVAAVVLWKREDQNRGWLLCGLVQTGTTAANEGQQAPVGSSPTREPCYDIRRHWPSCTVCASESPMFHAASKVFVASPR
jgi:hypothetical protein